MSALNTQVLMRRHPRGMVTPDDFSIVQSPLPTLGPDQALVRNRYLSLDPYMRVRMDDLRSYVPPLKLGELMPGATVGEVVESRASALPVGTLVAAALGWQEYGVVSPGAVRIVDPALGPPSAALGMLGLTGITAHYGLLQIGKPQPGETVLVSAAAGAVGSAVGQIAKLKGCRAVGIAGGPEKCRFAVDDLGFDACVDYRAPDFEAQLAAATPSLVNVLFENVGGPIMDASVMRLADFARIALCGVVSQYNETEPHGFRRMREMLVYRASLQGFVMTDHRDYFPKALPELAAWVAAGKLRYREDIVDGLENAPAAFIRMLTGRNTGKQLVRLVA